MKKLNTDNLNKIINDRDILLEDRLLHFYIWGQLLWLCINFVTSLLLKLPKANILMFGILAIGLLGLMLTSGVMHKKTIIKGFYFVGMLIAIPIMWLILDTPTANANVLFVGEVAMFAMCTHGKRQKVYITLSFIIQGLVINTSTKILQGTTLIDYTGTRFKASMNILSITSMLLIVLMMIKQKTEYELEKNIAQESERNLERSNALQKTFLANMSHEIRSPLNVVLGFNNLILESNDINQIHEYATNIKHAGSTLQTVINDILDYSKIEAGKLNIIPIDYSLKSLIKDIESEYSLKCKDKDLAFIVEQTDGLADQLYGDNIRIKQCVTNLLSNAVKYTNTGSITLKVSSTPTDVGYIITFEVADTGKGISEKDVKALFTAFQRLDETTNRGIEGTGLGLAITKNLTDNMNGSISVSSVEGQGSVFTISFPQENAKTVKSDTMQYNMTNNHSTTKHLNALVVDDAKINLTLMSKILQTMDVTAVCVDSGAKALEECDNNKFDIIFMDHMMPEMNGIETFLKLKESETNINTDTPVIMLTANAIGDAENEYLQLGFTAYLSKPVEVNKLNELIRQYQ